MRIAIYCGSSSGNNTIYQQAATEMGTTLAKHGISLVYGGGQVGLMGAVADAALAAGGEVIGIIPDALESKEIGHNGLSRLEVVTDMHARKKRMAELADGFIAMPGGVGTLEEIFEAWTWAQLGYHQKPCGFLNINGYYNALLQFLDQMTETAFMKPPHRTMVQVSDQPEALLAAFHDYQPPRNKWS